MKKPIIITWLSILLAMAAIAQDTTVQNLYFSPKNQKASKFKANDYEVGTNNAFYIYRNAVYRVLLTVGGDWLIRVTDIRNDSIYYEHFGKKKSFRKDSLFRLHPSEIGTIQTYDKSIGQLFNTFYLFNYNYRFTHQQEPKTFPYKDTLICSRDSTNCIKVELVHFIHGKSSSLIFLKCNKAFYYDENATPNCEEGMALEPPPPYPIRTRDVVWFTPSNAREINGINLGIQSLGLNRDSVTISGLNLNVDMLTAMLSIYLPFVPRDSMHRIRNMPDTIDYKEAKDKIYGLSISGGGVLGGRIHGVAFNGLLCMLTVSKGICITGLHNRIDEFQGLAIAGLVNRSIKGTGLQIGLVNKCKHLRGIQIGLWNENSKRKLPIINWNFSRKTG